MVSGVQPQDGGEYNGDLVSVYDEHAQRFRHGIRQGKGACTWRDGSTYNGDWFDGMRQGQGDSTDARGNQYSGEWKNDQMHGKGQMTMAGDERVITGNWMRGKLQGSSSIKYKKGNVENVRWRDGQRVINEDKNVTQGRTWGCGIIFNTVMVAVGVGCGVGAFFVKDQSTRNQLLAGAACMYLGQFVESFCSTHWGLLCNQVSQKEGYERLESYRSLKPSVTYTIRNFHYEMREVKVNKVVRADSEAVSLKRDYERKLKKVQSKMKALKAEIDSLAVRSILERLLPGQKDLDTVRAQYKHLKEKERMILQFLDSEIGADKTIQVSKFVNERVDTGGRTYRFKVEEWVDHTEDPSTLKAHNRLPFLAVQISQNATISKLAQSSLTQAAVKIREDNHTDIPHNMRRSERDTLHEMSQQVGTDGVLYQNMLIMNCDYYSRPDITKKRYYFLASLIGCTAFIRNTLQRQIFETRFHVEKHVETISKNPQK